ncbi:glycosyltransferase family 4 protein [Herbiconiux sp. UC225_62]|uniref:glycosyltransferase family 4 protein n=1 Tax=Herbiconiux sp. UC225_62 TaxID=3350168 RepID=UPI0036D41204
MGSSERDGAGIDPMTKVLYCHPGAEMYGSDRMAVETVVALSAANIGVTVAVPNTGPLVDTLETRGIDHVIIDVPVLRKQIMRPLPFLKYVVKTLESGVEIARLLRRERPTVVFVNTITQPVWILVSWFHRVPVIVHVRENESQYPRLLRALLVSPLRLARLAISNSKSTQEFIVGSRILPNRTKRLIVIYNGKDWTPYYLREPEHGGTTARLIVVGRISPRKGQDVVIRALAILQDRGIECSLDLVGDVFPGYEWFADELRQLAVDTDLAESVTFSGFTEDIAGHLADAQIAIVPSRMEPFGTVAAESMAAKRPTIVSETEGLVEIVTDGVTGLVVPTDDPAALAAGIERLIVDQAFYERLALAGYEHVLSTFSSSAYGGQIVDSVRRVVAESSRKTVRSVDAGTRRKVTHR